MYKSTLKCDYVVIKNLLSFKKKLLPKTDNHPLQDETGTTCKVTLNPIAPVHMGIQLL